MAITNVGCIYDLTTLQSLQVIVIMDGSDAELDPHRTQIQGGQAWLDIDVATYSDPSFDINIYIAGLNP